MPRVTRRRSKVSRLTALRESVRTQLWPTPVAGIVLAVLAGTFLPVLDERWDQHLPVAVSDLVFGGGADAARTVLDAVASSLITVTSLTFSLTVVTLQLASSQFSPRLLRTFTRDRFVHGTLALFLGTFAYALTVLRSVRTGTDGAAPVVPQISVTVAFLLAVASVIGLVLFLAHLAREIRVETMLSTVHADARATADLLLPGHDDAPPPGSPVPEAPARAVVLNVPSSGFLCWVDEDELVEVATELDVVVSITRAPGGSLVAGTPLGLAWSPRGSGELPAEVFSSLTETVRRAIDVGPERTPSQDIAFGLRQLTDVANKALSPGINDPTTAVHALGHSSAFLCEVVGRGLGDVVRHDDEGNPRLVLHRPDVATLLDLAISQPRRYGASDALVLGRIAALLLELTSRTGTPTSDPSLAPVIEGQLRRLRATAAEQDFDDVETGELRRAFAAVHAALIGGGSQAGATRLA